MRGRKERVGGSLLTGIYAAQPDESKALAVVMPVRWAMWQALLKVFRIAKSCIMALSSWHCRRKIVFSFFSFSHCHSRESQEPTSIYSLKQATAIREKRYERNG